MRQKHPVFPKVPRTFWHRFRRRWTKPLEMLEEVISLGEALGTDSRSPRFESMNDAYWAAMRSLHARTCLHARGVLALLSNGLVDPAWPQWRVCHESSTIARFIAEKPEMAPRYLNYSYVNKYQMARELYEIESNQAPGNVELNNLKKLADRVQQDLEKDYGHSQSSRDYGWSGRRSFKDIEAEVSKGDAWNPRGEYRLSSERVHSAPNAGEPFHLHRHNPSDNGTVAERFLLSARPEQVAGTEHQEQIAGGFELDSGPGNHLHPMRRPRQGSLTAGAHAGRATAEALHLRKGAQAQSQPGIAHEN